MTLIDTQRRFSAWLAGGHIDVSAMMGPRAGRGLAVYRHAVGATLTAALRDSFGKTHAWLGEKAFDAAAVAHIQIRPSTSWTLSNYGEGFEATLAELYPYDPEVAELAWLDWSLRRAFEGPDPAEIDPADLAEIDWDAAILCFAPALAWRTIATNAAAIWRALSVGETPPAAASLDGPAGLIVWRQGLEPRFRTVDPVEQAALESALRGEDFATVCEMTARADPLGDPVRRVGELLAQWLGEGLIVGVI
ncbi:MAG TPA: DNA-binding domain-containing protein [Caulobacteraceae bacterium]|jgi:hypothetical protein